MNEYQRFVSYIYSYPGNVKDKNVGFAKIEVRNGQCRLDMTLRGVYSDASRIFGIFVMVKDTDDEGYILIPIGEVVINSGQGKYRDTLNPDNLNNSGYKLENVLGIAVADKEDSYYRMFSLWNDDLFRPERIHYKQETTRPEADTVDKFEPDNKEESASKTRLVNKTFPASEDVSESEEVNGSVIKDQSESKEVSGKIHELVEDKLVEDKSVEDKVVEIKADTVEVDENIVSMERNKNESEAVLNSELVQAASINDNGFELLLKNGDIIDAFDDDFLYNCIEVMPEQLKSVMDGNELDKNSFLIHGFFRFRHLLFGRITENDNNSKYFLGVPGMYCNRERYMASTFGFSNFKKSHRCDYSNPYFGYWYMEL